MVVDLYQIDMSQEVNIRVPVDKLEFIYKAVREKEPKEDQNFFAYQNPATKKLVQIFEEHYDAMSQAMFKEIKKVLDGTE